MVTKKNISLRICFILLVAPLLRCYSQNLVPNPSFENNISCNIYYDAPPPPPWYGPNLDTALRANPFNTCSIDLCCKIPYISYGQIFQYAHTGNSMVGIFTYHSNYSNYRSYAQVSLLDTLKSNHYYNVHFYVNSCNGYKFATNNLELLFSDTAIFVNNNNNPFGLIPAISQIIGASNPIIVDTMNWIKISGSYKAIGGEKFITIGNFQDDAHTQITNFNSNGFPAAGYFLDDVSVIDSFTLPVNLLYFKVKRVESYNTINWQTATEINTSHFNIQRSTTGKDFATIGKVNAKGASEYTFNDPLTTEDARFKKLYYRLQIVDKDGALSYSEVRELSIVNSSLSISPNPAKDNVTVSGANLKQVKLLDNMGRVVVVKEAANSNSVSIPVSHIIKGIYMVQATFKDGSVKTEKVMVE